MAVNLTAHSDKLPSYAGRGQCTGPIVGEVDAALLQRQQVVNQVVNAGDAVGVRLL